MLELKEYQEEASRIVEDKFNNGINRTCIIWPTGLGKTYVPVDLMRKHPNQRFLVIAPRHSILEQTRRYMLENGVNKEDANFYTYAGLAKMDSEVMGKLNPDYIILDEMHRAGAKEWGKGIDRLLDMYPKSNVLGLTATPTRMDGQNIVEEKFNGDISHQITLEEAIARGLLQMPKSYINAAYSLDGEIGDIEKSIQNIKDETERKELTAKLEQVKRKLKESKGLPEIFEERISNKDGKYIIFCKDINHMHEMMERANEWFKGVNENIDLYSISSEKNNLQNERELRHFEENNGKSLKLLYSVNMFNEGLHINNDGVIMLRPTSSWIIYLQQLGRTLGIQESGQVFDIVNNSRSSKDIYKFSEAIGKIQKKEKIDGVNIDFTIHDEIRDIRDVLDEINQSIHIDYLSFEEKIEYLKKLQNKGKDLSKIRERDVAEDGRKIGIMINEFRQSYKKGKLTEEEIEEIEELGIVLQAQKNSKLTNKEKIEYLKELQKRGKDLSQIKATEVSEDGRNIGNMIMKLRQSYRKGKLSEEEIEELEELGVLQAKVSSPLTNKEKIEYLKKLQNKGKDLSQIKKGDVADDGRNIGSMIREFRQSYKKGKLSEEEIEELARLDINVQPQRNSYLTNGEKIEYLKNLKDKGEDVSQIKVRDKSKDGIDIGMMISTLRRSYKKGKLTEEEIEKLTKLGVRLSLKEKQQEKEVAQAQLEQAKELCEKYEQLLETTEKSNLGK